MQDAFDFEAHGYEQTNETCPDCGGQLFERHSEGGTVGGQTEPDLHERVCENHPPNGECEHYEETSVCPECGSTDLEGEVSGPDRMTGARAGRVACTDCTFVYHWSE